MSNCLGGSSNGGCNPTAPATLTASNGDRPPNTLIRPHQFTAFTLNTPVSTGIPPQVPSVPGGLPPTISTVPVPIPLSATNPTIQPQPQPPPPSAAAAPAIPGVPIINPGGPTMIPAIAPQPTVSGLTTTTTTTSAPQTTTVPQPAPPSSSAAAPAIRGVMAQGPGVRFFQPQPGVVTGFTHPIMAGPIMGHPYPPMSVAPFPGMRQPQQPQAPQQPQPQPQQPQQQQQQQQQAQGRYSFPQQITGKTQPPFPGMHMPWRPHQQVLPTNTIPPRPAGVVGSFNPMGTSTGGVPIAAPGGQAPGTVGIGTPGGPAPLSSSGSSSSINNSSGNHINIGNSGNGIGIGINLSGSGNGNIGRIPGVPFQHQMYPHRQMFPGIQQPVFPKQVPGMQPRPLGQPHQVPHMQHFPRISASHPKNQKMNPMQVPVMPVPQTNPGQVAPLNGDNTGMAIPKQIKLNTQLRTSLQQQQHQPPPTLISTTPTPTPTPGSSTTPLVPSLTPQLSQPPTITIQQYHNKQDPNRIQQFQFQPSQPQPQQQQFNRHQVPTIPQLQHIPKMQQQQQQYPTMQQHHQQQQQRISLQSQQQQKQQQQQLSGTVVMSGTGEEDQPIKKKRGPKKGVKRGKYKKHKLKEGGSIGGSGESEALASLGDHLTIARFETRKPKRRMGRPGRKRGRRRRVQANDIDENDSDGDFKSGYEFRKRSRQRYNEDDLSEDEYDDDENGDGSGDDDNDRNGYGSTSSDFSDSDVMSNLDDSFMSTTPGIADPFAPQSGVPPVTVEKIYTHRITEKNFPVPPSPEPNFQDLHYLHHKRTAADRGLPSWGGMEESGGYVDGYLGVDVSIICPVFTAAEVAEEHDRLRGVAERLRARRQEVEPRVVAEYLVKLKGRSYIHTCWLDATEMDAKDQAKVKRYWKKMGVVDEAEGLSMNLTGIPVSNDDDIFEPPIKREDGNSKGEAEKKDNGSAENGGNDDDKNGVLVKPSVERGLGKGVFFDESFTEIDRIVGRSKSLDGSTTLYYVKWCGLPYTEATWEKEEDIDDPEKIEEYKKFHLLPTEPPNSPLEKRLWIKMEKSPEFRHQHTLRDFQLEGLNWLIYCWCHGRGSILADEMGLGKTVQSIAFMQHLRSVQMLRGPFLVVAPLSTISNWKREVEEWTDMNVVVYTGNAQNREEIKKWEWFYLDDEGKQLGREIKFNILLTTYDMVRNDAELPRIKWQVMVVDEAQNVKNFKGKLMEALRSISTYHKILLTGTPIQNSVEELWSLLQFIDPENFSDREDFLLKYGRIEQVDQAQSLREKLRPYMLHRKKSDVDKDIPPLEETIIEVELSMLQKQYYRAVYERNRDFLNRGTAASTNIASSPTNSGSLESVSTSYERSSSAAVTPLNNVMMQLRKVCDHPFLLKNVEQKELPPELAASNPSAYMKALVRASGKTVLIDKLLPKLKEDGHKVLIFSQLKGVLDLLGRYLTYHGYLYERIDGSITGPERNAAINRFNKPGSDRFAFLLSTRAGGLGINLQAADTVILYDSDWNPQNDVQAQARSHRIGQKKQVKVYRLVTKDTYERQMFEIASRKLGLDRAIMANVNTSNGDQSAGSPTASSSSVTGLDKEEMQRLLKMGAYGLRKDEAESYKETEAFNESTIDDILEKRTKNIIHHDDGQGSQFSMAAFTFDDSTANVNLDDPDFWKKTLPEAATSKALLSQFTEAIGRSKERKEEWVNTHKCSFIHRLEEVVDDVLKSFNEARGDMSITERSDALGLTQMCLSHKEFFDDIEIARLNMWFEKLSMSCSRRKARIDYSAQEQSMSSSSRRKQQKKSPASRKKSSLKDGSVNNSDGDDDENNGSGFNTRIAASSYMSDDEYEKKSKTLKLKVKKRRKMTIKGGDDDDDDDDDGGDSGDDYEDNAGAENEDGDENGDGGDGANKKKKRGKKGDGKGGADDDRKKWSNGDRRNIQNATFSFCRPYWAGIRTRAGLKHKSIKEIRETVMYFLSQIVSSTKSEPKFNEGFKSMVSYFICNDNDDDDDDDVDDPAKKRMKLSANPALSTEAIPLAYASQEARKDLNELIPTRTDGWLKRWKIMSAIRTELENAEAEGRKPLEKSTPIGRPPSPDAKWWDSKTLDADLLVGIHRHGWGNFDAIIADKTLGFSKVLRDKIEEYNSLTKPPGPLYKYVEWPTSRAMESHIRALVKSANANGNSQKSGKQRPAKKKTSAGNEQSSSSSAPAAAASSSSGNGGDSKAKKAKKKKVTLTITTKGDKKKSSKD